MIKAAKTFLSRFRRDRSGISAVEFALIAPLMVLLYIGMVEISLALAVDRKVTNTASSLADLIAQDDIITDDEMNDIMNAGAAILEPFDSTPLGIRITSVSMSLLGEVEVDWSDARGVTPRAEGSQPTLPDGILSAGRSIVWVEVSYQYNAPFEEIVGTFEIAEQFFLRPRQSLIVARN